MPPFNMCFLENMSTLYDVMVIVDFLLHRITDLEINRFSLIVLDHEHVPSNLTIQLF